MDIEKTVLPAKLRVVRAVNFILGGISFLSAVGTYGVVWSTDLGDAAGLLSLWYFGLMVVYLTMAGIIKIQRRIVFVAECVWSGISFLWCLINIAILGLIIHGVCLFLLLNRDSRTYYTKSFDSEAPAAEDNITPPSLNSGEETVNRMQYEERL